MTKQNRQQTRKSNIARLSMNDWCKVIAGIASKLTEKQAQPIIRKMAARLATSWNKDEAKMVAHLTQLTKEAA